MKTIYSQLKSIITDYSVKLKELTDGNASIRTAPSKWSKKEELGHLIDSAHNNLRRFIVGQYEDQSKIVYDQNEWVKLNDYNSLPVLQLTRLWLLLNQQIVQVLEKMSPEASQRLCDTGREKPELHTLEWLADDYIKHVLHHLHHLLELEPVSY